MAFTISVDTGEVIRALDKLDPKGSKSAVQKGLKKAGNFLAGKGRAEAPSKPRRLKRTIRARSAKRDRPGVVVTARHNLNPIVQGGTRDRYTRSGAFRGRIEPNPFMKRVADRHDDEALRIAGNELENQLGL